MTVLVEQFQKAGRNASGLLSALIAGLRAGHTTSAVASRARELLAPLDLAPATDDDSPWLSVNINEEACHALPGPRVIRPGDIVTLDLAVRTVGPDPAPAPAFVDLARTVVVGRDASRRHDRQRHDQSRQALAAATLAVNRAVLAALRPAGRWSDAAAAGAAAAARHNCVLAPGFPGHGIGAALHLAPVAGFHGEADFELEPGLAFTVEPILIPAPGAELITLADGWTVVTADGRDAAFAEWTVLIGADGPRVIAS